jgi:septum formation protein
MIARLALKQLNQTAIMPMVDTLRSIILASGSSARRAMLEQAGVVFSVEPAQVDEDAIRDALLARDLSSLPAEIAQALAKAKAEAVSARHPESFVIGSDQILNIGPIIMTKPGDLAKARETLLLLRGRTHQLHSAVSIVIEGEAVWCTVDTVNLTMRSFSDTFLDRYLELEGNDLLTSVGAFKIEGRGLQLFEKIDGDYFTILGMPLLPVLEELRVRGALAS